MLRDDIKIQQGESVKVRTSRHENRRTYKKQEPKHDASRKSEVKSKREKIRRTVLQEWTCRNTEQVVCKLLVMVQAKRV